MFFVPFWSAGVNLPTASSKVQCDWPGLMMLYETFKTEKSEI